MTKKRKDLVEGEDFYFENGLMVLTEKYHLDRGFCCKNKCRHCPYMKEWTEISPEIKNYFQENQLRITKYEIEYFEPNTKRWTIFCDNEKVVFEQFFNLNFFKKFVVI